MGKYRVKVYYEFVAAVEVDADDINEAYEIGRENAQDIPNSSLDYIQELEVEVIPYDSQGRLDFSEMETF